LGGHLWFVFGNGCINDGFVLFEVTIHNCEVFLGSLAFLKQLSSLAARLAVERDEKCTVRG